MTEPETVKPGETPLSPKHRLVLDEYLKCFRQIDAYKRVYPTASHNSAKSAASRLFSDVNFLAHLEARREEIHMGVDEALKLHADIARGDMGDFMDNDFSLVLGGEAGEDGEPAKPRPNTRLIKKIKVKTTKFISNKEDRDDKEITETELQLYPADQAQVNILKIHGKFKDKGESSSDVKVPITVVEIVRPDGK